MDDTSRRRDRARIGRIAPVCRVFRAVRSHVSSGRQEIRLIVRRRDRRPLYKRPVSAEVLTVRQWQQPRCSGQTAPGACDPAAHGEDGGASRPAGHRSRGFVSAGPSIDERNAAACPALRGDPRRRVPGQGSGCRCRPYPQRSVARPGDRLDGARGRPGQAARRSATERASRETTRADRGPRKEELDESVRAEVHDLRDRLCIGACDLGCGPGGRGIAGGRLRSGAPETIQLR